MDGASTSAGNTAVSYAAHEPIVSVLCELADALAATTFPFSAPRSSEGRAVAERTVAQLNDYLIARYTTLDAPLLAVIGGSTGAGKSTLVNSIVRSNVARASAIRPTTRRPTLVYNPLDESWFNNARILPHLARVSGAEIVASEVEHSQAITEVGLTPSPAVPAGLALLDSPDIDSVVKENRELAHELLAAADLWIFVTTAARYADAVPWELLREAAERDVVVAVVLNRVPQNVADEVSADLAAKLRDRHLEQAPLFVIPESELNQHGYLPDSVVQPLRTWIENLAGDAATRANVARTTLRGAVGALITNGHTVQEAVGEQVAIHSQLTQSVTTYFDDAVRAVAQQVGNGSLLKGELLSRWQDVVGTGEWTRKLEGGISRLRDRVVSMVTGKPSRDVQQAQRAIEDGVFHLVAAQLNAAHNNVVSEWEQIPAARFLLSEIPASVDSDIDRDRAIAALVHDWQSSLIDLVRAEGASKKTMARILSFGVNAVGVALMILVFANTGGLVGGEVAVAGGTAVVAQKILEGVFGDDAIRRMSARVKDDLIHRVQEQADTQAQIYLRALARTGVDKEHAIRLEESYARVSAVYESGA